MGNLEQEMPLVESAVQERVTKILADMIEDWDVSFEGPITAATKLIQDLEFESIDVVQLVVAIEQEFDARGISFNDLIMSDGRYVDDLSVGEISSFLASQSRDA